MGKTPDDESARGLNERVGHEIARARNGRGLTQKQLADAITEAQTTVSDYENGKTAVPLSRLVAIEDALDVGRGTLFVASGLVPIAVDVLDLIRRDPTIADDRRQFIIDMYELSRVAARPS